MIALRIEFVAGRFHANPWNAGTNEGEIDWPPSPWRLLRAVVSGWFRSGAPEPETFVAVLDALRLPPEFLLPVATSGHTRHYMQLGTFKAGVPAKALVLDSFLALERDREHCAVAYVFWRECTLSPAERVLLEGACRHISYLGRAESWCVIDVVDDVPTDTNLEHVAVATQCANTGPIARRLTAGPALQGQSLFASLCERTEIMRRDKRLEPKGTAWVNYVLPSTFLQVREQYARSEEEERVFGPLLLRFAVERPRQGVRPPITRAIDIGDLMRRAAMRRYSDLHARSASLRLAGKATATDATPRQGHDHPYYLPSDSSERGTIDRIDVWLPQGCRYDEYRAIASIPELRDRYLLDEPLPLTFLGNALPDAPSRIWHSSTPLVLERFPKWRGEGRTQCVDSPEQQVTTMIRRQLGRDDVQVSIWPAAAHIPGRAGGIRLDAFRRSRPGKPLSPQPFVGASLVFEQPVSGPIALGRQAHFGLGQFKPES